MNIGQTTSYGTAPQPAVSLPQQPVVTTPPVATGSSQPAVLSSLVGVAAAPSGSDQSGSGNVNQTALKQSVATINNYLNSFTNNSIEFSVDPSTQRVVVKVVDGQNDTVVMQTPSKAALAIAQALDKTQGLLIQTKA